MIREIIITITDKEDGKVAIRNVFDSDMLGIEAFNILQESANILKQSMNAMAKERNLTAPKKKKEFFSRLTINELNY